MESFSGHAKLGLCTPICRLAFAVVVSFLRSRTCSETTLKGLGKTCLIGLSKGRAATLEHATKTFFLLRTEALNYPRDTFCSWSTEVSHSFRSNRSFHGMSNHTR